MNLYVFKPCPWCNSTDIAVESEQIADRVVTGVDEDNGPVYWAECQHCGARGPLVGWAADAIPKWNESDTALSALAQARGEWVACSERMPEIGTEVLAVLPCAKADTVFIVLHDGMTWYDRDGNTFAMHPTHWRPLPTPPETSTASGV
jgi:hypothetical protein